MAAKNLVLVIENNEVQGDKTFDRVLNTAKSMMNELNDIVEYKEGKTGLMPVKTFPVDPEKKREFKSILAALASTFLAPVGGQGRNPKWDYEKLQKCFLHVKREYSGASLSVQCRVTAHTYNQHFTPDRNPENWISEAVVTSIVNKNGWKDLPAASADSLLIPSQ